MIPEELLHCFLGGSFLESLCLQAGSSHAHIQGCLQTCHAWNPKDKSEHCLSGRTTRVRYPMRWCCLPPVHPCQKAATFFVTPSTQLPSDPSWDPSGAYPNFYCNTKHFPSNTPKLSYISHVRSVRVKSTLTEHTHVECECWNTPYVPRCRALPFPSQGYTFLCEVPKGKKHL